ncbi:DedA family protein [Candidatus Gottesmanbacteria bacterium]|nr:DedA family protein [Candidatus Gottesmanbacteria bacterium]
MDIYQFITSAFAQYGYIIIFLGACLESILVLGFILPGGVVVLLGGYFASQGQLSLTIVIFLAWMGMFIGDMLNYLLGKGSFVNFFQKFIKSNQFTEKKKLAQKYINEYGGYSIFYSHIIGHLRSVISFTAGAVGYPWRKFVGVVIVASLIWSVIFSAIGYFVGNTTVGVRNISERTTIITLAIATIMIGLHIIQKLIVKVSKKI